MEHPLRVARRRGALPSLAISNRTRPESMSVHHGPVPTDRYDASCPMTCGIDRTGSGMVFPMASIPPIDYRYRDVIVVQRNMLRPEGCRASGTSGRCRCESSKPRAQATRGCRRRQEARPERAQRRARAQHPVPDPKGDAPAPFPFALVIFRVPSIHNEELPWLSNSTDCHRKNCRP